MPNATGDLIPALSAALPARLAELDEAHQAALRLFNGFVEGWPDLAVDVYGGTLLLFNYAAGPAGENIAAAVDFYRQALPWLTCGVVKHHRADDPALRRGQVLFGGPPERKVRQHGAWYAVDLLMNQDASLYLDTRLLRAWASQNLAGQRVLNTFAYTGSLGVAAMSGGASQVMQVDLNRAFLNQAKTSYTLNGFPIRRGDFRSGDFFSLASDMRQQGAEFDCIFLDPPFFSQTTKGRVDLNQHSARLINKVRPLAAKGGRIVAINNALFVSGAAYLAELHGLCADGYLEIETLIPVGADFTGSPASRRADFPSDPAPFNHPTKIAVLRVTAKKGS